MMKQTSSILIILALVASLSAVEFRIMTYNSLNFNSDDADRAVYFGQIVQEVDPDIIIMQEMHSAAGVNLMLDYISEVEGDYEAAEFYNGYDSDNILYYKPFAVTLVDQGYIPTDLREIGEYELEVYGEPLRIYSCHLKASQGYEDQRLAEVTILRNHLNALPSGTEFVVGGDMNIYTSSEPGYQKFIANESDNDGRSFDPLPAGNWHNNGSYSDIHTQSTRDTQVGGGASGGLDDRFDFLFLKYGLDNNDGIEYVANSCIPYGNDGDHFNDAINDGNNGVVTNDIADALYYASDHLPVYGDFTSIEAVELELVAFRVEDNTRTAQLSWITRNEDLLGYYIYHSATSNFNDAVQCNDMIAAHNSASTQYYSFDATASQGYNYYWLEMVGLNGETALTNSLRYYSTPVSENDTPAVSIAMNQNYPNPFNPSTTIEYSVSEKCEVELAVYNLRGQRVRTLVNDKVTAGTHRAVWDGKDSAGSISASGVYFSRLTVGDKVCYRKMVLTK